MSSKHEIAAALAKVLDQPSFFNILLSQALKWPTPDVKQIEDIAYGWSAEDLNAAEIQRNLIDGPTWQIQPAEKGQPWGIFVLEFKRPDILSPHRGMAGVLRAVLRGLVGSRRKDAKLPSWKREHLLFICTHGWQSFRFAYFRARPDDPKASRLTTFGWAPGTSNRTVCEFNLPALVWPSDTSDAAEWVRSWSEAFNKEPLTRDFFRRFDEALDAAKADLQEYQKLSSAEAYTHAQLMLERLIFLYFLQNRGWLNQDRRYLPDQLREHFQAPDSFTYYKEFLDKLFWTLSTPPGTAGRLPGIPFLNGGLFDDDEFSQPAELRKTNPPLKVRNSTFQLVFRELLEAFNFTVTEDTPLNQEVAVDPEMLGKVFESIVLHAEAADPDATAPDKRKATGSYYTPRIVVHFICREVLYQYLHARLPGAQWSATLRTVLDLDASDGLNEEARERLKTATTPEQAVQLRELVLPLKCCDPAVGSGAFPVGLLHELVNLRRLLTTAANGYVDPVRGEGSTWLHDTKADIVQNCLFGVDIQQQAIEICRLRLWLTLVVDYDLGLDPFTAERSQFRAAIDRISQLPNLEMNFYRGDSLHDHICGVPIVILPDRASRHADAFRAVYKLGDRLHKAKTGEQKRKLRLEILGKRLALSSHILDEELRALRSEDSALDGLFGLADSAAKKRERLTREIEQLESALKKVEADREELERLKNRVYDNQFYPKLRKLEGADFDSPFNFAWTIDFPGIFSVASISDRRFNDVGDQRSPLQQGGGFDIMVGNPPFVTARNPKKRELWRQRWPRVSFREYELVAPFFELGFGLLRDQGQLGFIASNGFAKREFGRPLVEHFFAATNLQKTVDCSGLSFPGHGTPTCILFGSRRKPEVKETIRNVVTLPGGGDLLTPPEESPLWHSISAHHAVEPSKREGYILNGPEAVQGFRKLHEDFNIAVGDCDRTRMLAHPCRWAFVEWPTFDYLSKLQDQELRRFLKKDIGRVLATSANDIYIVPGHSARLWALEQSALIGITEGDEIRNWAARQPQLLLKPYDESWNLATLDKTPKMARWLASFRKPLGNRRDFDGATYDEAGRSWYEYHQLDRDKARADSCVAFPDVVTHGHFLAFEDVRLFKDHSPIILMDGSRDAKHLLVALLNSSAALFWLKQVCFNKGAGEDEHRDRFEYAGGKVEQLPVPQAVAEALKGRGNALSDRLTELSKACWERGQRLSGLALKRLFEEPGEAYHHWNSSLPGYVPPNPELGAPFQTESDLRNAYPRAQANRDRLRAEMIELQEEMDWLVYAAYDLLPARHPAVAAVSSPPTGDQRSPLQEVAPLDQAQRPFRLWGQAEGDCAKALALIPADWNSDRRKLWEARLAAIRDNDHIRRIEQPVYERRWDEQWKVGNQWRSGPVAYAAEFVEAFEWWLSEKAEWWLEHKKNGGLVELDDWAVAIWKDPRVQAAWPVAAENYTVLAQDKHEDKAEAKLSPSTTADFVTFKKAFNRIIDEETVPEGIPFAVPYEDLEKKLKRKVPAHVQHVRGKLNVPRERFHLRGKTQYLWAGLQIK